MIVEWTAHVFSSDLERYPLYEGAHYIPGEERFLPDPLTEDLASLDARGIDRAVLVHPEPYGDDHRFIIDCLAREPGRLKGTCLFFPRDPRAVGKMEALVEREPRIVALRFHAVRAGRGFYFDSLADEGVRRLWRWAGELGLIIELHIGPAYAVPAAKEIQSCPDFPVVIDHLGKPDCGTPEEYESVVALSRFDNVYMKISAVRRVSCEPEPHLDAKPLVGRLASAFGPDRLVWGGGSPSVVDLLLDDLSEAERAKIKGDSLAAMLDFG